MNLAADITRLLSERLGLSPDLLGSVVVERALQTVLEKAGSEGRGEGIAHLLQGEGEEWQALVDEVTVPETWFFRDREPFQLLTSYVREMWRPANPTALFQVLCIPCCSGEEPYSVAMTLLDAGLDAQRIRIDAGDVSERALVRARRGVYGKRSFREKPNHLEEQYFVPVPEGWRIREEVTALVRFERANLLDLSLYRPRAPYNAVFCRNALIYLEERVRREVIGSLRDLLLEDGLLFTGHSELMPFLEAGFMLVDYPQSFACRKAGPENVGMATCGASRGINGDSRKAGGLGPHLQDPQVNQVSHGPHRPLAGRLCRPQDGDVGEGALGARPKLRHLPPPTENGTMGGEPVLNGGAAAPSLGIEDAGQLADRGELAAAAAICERMLENGIHDPDVYSLLGMISESGGKLEAAEDFFRKALFLDPNHYQSLVCMSLLSERHGDTDGSRLFRARAGRVREQQEHDRLSTR